MSYTKWFIATVAVVLMAGNVSATDTVASGKIKSINADKGTFVLTDSADKDFTFKLGENLVVNRAGKESKADLQSGDMINICYDKGVLNWTAHYILVREGKSKNCELIRGSIKGFDADRKELSFTDEAKKDSTYSLDKAKVRLNMEDSTIENAKIGDHALLIVDTVEGKPMLHCVMINRAK